MWDFPLPDPYFSTWVMHHFDEEHWPLFKRTTESIISLHHLYKDPEQAAFAIDTLLDFADNELLNPRECNHKEE